MSANGPTESIRSGGGAALASGESPPLVGSLFVCSRWQCYSSHHRTQRVCYSLLLRLLRTIDAGWDPTAVRGDLVGGPEKKEKKKKNQNKKESSIISLAPRWRPSRFLVKPKMSGGER